MNNTGDFPWTWSAGSITDARGDILADPGQWSVSVNGRTITVTGPGSQWRATPRGLTTSVIRVVGESGEVLLERNRMGFGRRVCIAGTAVARTRVPRDGRVILAAVDPLTVDQDLLVAALLVCGTLDGPGTIKG